MWTHTQACAWIDTDIYIYCVYLNTVAVFKSLKNVKTICGKM